MTSEQVWRAPEVERPGGANVAPERQAVEELLDYHRATLLWKCGGLTGEQLARRACPPSTLSLLGLVRHMAEVERSWFRRRFSGQDVPKRYQSESDPDGDFNGAVAEQAAVDEAWAAWSDEIAFARSEEH